MIIRRIEMYNFRGFRSKTIDFENKSVVLLSGANGIGKTTVVDAIEWCLTGEIGRLKNAFDTRSTNEMDRRMNADGILKNREAKDNEQVKVVLCLMDGKNERILSREQKKDDLKHEAKSSKVMLDGDEETAKVFIREYVGKSFYNYHFCDVQKSFNVQSKKRENLKDFFSEFIMDYNVQKMIAQNLDIFAEDVARYIEDKTNQKVKPEIIRNYEKQRERVREETKQIPYPEIIFYPEEKAEITGLNKEELTMQKTQVKNCGYQIAKEKLSILVENESLKNQCSLIKEIATIWEIKGELIQQALKAGVPKNTDLTSSQEEKLRKLKMLSLSKDTILKDGESVLALQNDGFTPDDFEDDKIAIRDKERIVKDISDEIKLLSGNNKILKILASLSTNKQVVIDYRDLSFKENGTVHCPICGSETFATMDEALILKEADDYIRQNGELVKRKEGERTSLNEEIDTLYQKIIDRAKCVIEKEIELVDDEIRRLKDLQAETQPYFEKVNKLQKNSKQTIYVDELTAEKITDMLAVVEKSLLVESKEQEARAAYQKILSVLGYKFENETVQQTYAKVKNLIPNSYNVANFNYDVFVSKLNAIDSILANQMLSDLNKTIEECNKKNNSIDEEIEELKKLRTTALERASDIREVVNNLSKAEYEKVGPNICKFYNKLARFNYHDGINIIPKDNGISLVDNKDKNLVNILSNGQISVFMLAHFFAGINTRNAHEKMKVYFIDDLTACMDDVNMLAFMDLLKYQMSSKETMKQLFFVTCDERISNLLKYKMNGRGIELCELSETDLVS